ncbi:MAG: efflux RND transporter permease subunit, partial [Rhizobiales bacterium]|nr:efflux RND transporter permease subunit [Hyphomicrobiales bacterium]
RSVEERVLTFGSLKTVYTRVGEQPRGQQEMSEDTIGVIQFEFVDWKQRPPAHEIMDAIREKTADIPGVLVEVTAPRAGPPTGKPVQIQLSAIDPDVLPEAARKVAGMLRTRPEIRDLDDGLPLPGIDWKIDVNKAEAAKYGAGVNTVGNVVQLVTNGTKITEYRPSDNDKSVDIIVRFPENRRSLDQIDELRVQTSVGHVPIGNFVERVPAPRVGYINRVGGNRVITVQANVAEGVQTAVVQQQIASELSAGLLGPNIFWKLKGEDEEREKAGAFLMKAFGAAVFLIFAILLAQFNKLTSVGLVLTAVILSTIGVLLGAMVMRQPFGVVMTGIGVIANAGVIVNNNIVLIDTYDRLRREGIAAYEAILETCRERARPVVLTAVTAILGVLPIAFGMNVEFLHRELTVGAPATQWWISLSTAIVFGLGFATLLTLIVTPAALMAIANMAEWRQRFVARRRQRREERAAALGASPPGPIGQTRTR